jgi:hypothetical protein
MGGVQIGLAAQPSDDDLRATVIRKAAGHDIVLESEQIAARQSGAAQALAVFLAATYRRGFGCRGDRWCSISRLLTGAETLPL